MHSFRAAIIVPLYCLLTGLLTPAQVNQPKAPANTEPRRIQNIAPEEMWNRVTQCTFPKYPALAVASHITGTIDMIDALPIRRTRRCRIDTVTIFFGLGPRPTSGAEARLVARL
jgi:hypothetical protein